MALKVLHVVGAPELQESGAGPSRAARIADVLTES
jgi:hypothetical protein